MKIKEDYTLQYALGVEIKKQNKNKIELLLESDPKGESDMIEYSVILNGKTVLRHAALDKKKIYDLIIPVVFMESKG